MSSLGTDDYNRSNQQSEPRAYNYNYEMPIDIQNVEIEIGNHDINDREDQIV